MLMGEVFTTWIKRYSVVNENFTESVEQLVSLITVPRNRISAASDRSSATAYFIYF